MSIKTMVENRIWDEKKQEWVSTIPITHAQAVETADGKNVQAALDAVPVAIDGAIAEVRGGVPEEGDTLGKLHGTIAALQELLQSDDETLDTLQEVVDFIKEHKDELDKIGTDKVGYEDIVNSLETVSTVEGKALDARQGKILKDALDALGDVVDELKEQTGDYVTQDELSAVAAAARPVISEIAPENPLNGQLWLKPVGTIDV